MKEPSPEPPSSSMSDLSELVSRARTNAPARQLELIPCAWVGCEKLFAPRYPGQRFHSGACRAAYSREIGLTGKLKSSRRLTRGISLVFHTDDVGVLDAPIGTRFRLVREP